MESDGGGVDIGDELFEKEEILLIAILRGAVGKSVAEAFEDDRIHLGALRKDCFHECKDLLRDGVVMGIATNWLPGRAGSLFPGTTADMDLADSVQGIAGQEIGPAQLEVVELAVKIVQIEDEEAVGGRGDDVCEELSMLADIFFAERQSQVFKAQGAGNDGSEF